MIKMLTMILLAMTLVSCSSTKKSKKCCDKKKCDAKQCKMKEKCDSKNCKHKKQAQEAKDEKAQDGAAAKEVKEASTSSGSANASTVNCTLNSDTRIIAINTMDTGCEVIYTKFGEANSVATDSAGTDYCQTVSDRIQNNLENAGFGCK